MQELINEMGYTQWSGKMYRDLNMEKTLEVFRENKEEILASLPKEVVEAYYPDRVAVGDDTVIKTDSVLDDDMNTWHEDKVSDRPIIKMGNVIQFPKAHNPNNYESEEKE
ncbi:uncharacterized protein METZ01_LOCUS382436 [marine metagenome]|uniref:Uncharacterized protein n=1 Tax=marine metagenome TaxID=408172 RepID=A0A382U6F0_9ZZZZ